MNRSVTLILALCLLFVFSRSLQAQKPYIPFQHYSSADGLTQNQILSIFQDQQGYMWFGTLEGLNRFDGYEFTSYHPKTNDSTSLSHDFANYVMEDKQGTLWVCTGGGLSKFHRSTNTFSSYIYNPAKKNGISRGLINKMTEDRQGNFWLAFATGYVDYFDRNKNEFTHYAIDEGLDDITSLQIDRDENLWIGTQTGIVIMNKDHQEIERFHHQEDDPNSLSSNHINDIFLDDKNTIWIASDVGLNQYDPHHKSFIHYIHNELNSTTLSLNVIKCLGQDKEGRLWVGTENGGLDIFNIAQKEFYHFKHQESDPRGVSDNSIYSIFKDKHNNMWVGTNGSGINFYDRSRKPFVVYQNIPGDETSLSHNKVNAVTEQPDKGFWIATDGGGVDFFNETKHQFKTYRYHANDPQSLPSDFVVDVLWDDEDKCLWVATWGGGLAKMDVNTGRFKRFQHQENNNESIASNDLWRLYQDKEGVLYIGTVGNGFSIFNKKTSRFTNYYPSDGLAEENVVSIFRDANNFLWLGSWGTGLSLMNLSTRKFVPLPKGIDHNSNEFITGDSLGRVWISGNPGMQCYDVKNNTSFSLTTKDGLPSSNVNAFLDDRKGNFWLSTNKGIAKYNKAKKVSNVFTVSDGFPANQFSSRLLRTAKGRMYFGSVNGLIVFHPDSIKQNHNIPAVLITDLKIFNKSVFAGSQDHILTKHISETKEIWLPFEYNFISLSFVALSYTAAKQNQYAYKLESFDNDWVFIQNQRSATYTSLDPGNYTFRVKASNNDGIWNEEGATLIIHVMPPWWETVWFRSIVILILGLAAFGFYYYRVRAIEKHNKELNILVSERTKELNQLNEAVTNQNKILIVNEEELASKNEEISAQRDMLTKQNMTLLSRQDEIETQNEELKQSQEEISAQRDIVYAQNNKLEEARSIIEKQNEEIKLRNENLELEVAARTKELLEYNHQLEQFAFISAHNLRAPVARILGLGNILDLDSKPGTDNKHVYEKMVFTARELDRVVRDLNSILEIKKNNTAIVSVIDFTEEMALVKRYIEKEIEDTHCVIREDFSRAPMIKSVKPYVESIFQNLLTNAIKYRHPDRTPVISIHTETLDDYICLTVTDNGLGIDTTTHKEKIFNLYQRFHNHVEGKGLGLYLIKTQIVALGGKIEIESKVNEGTTFKIYFKRVRT